MEAKCQTCKFWVDDGDIDGIKRGVCRAAPPVIRGSLGFAVWPHTKPNDWCGGYKEVPTAVAKGEAKPDKKA